MQFQHPAYFFLALALLPMGWLWLRYLRWKQQRIKRIGDPELVAALTNEYSPRNFNRRALLAGLSALLLIAALATLRRPQGGDGIRRNGIDVMIALDVSRSMLAQDIRPSRLDRARQLIYKLIEQLPDDRIGMVLFAGKAYLQLPLTTDHAAVRMYLASIGTDAVPTQGTVLTEALKMCYSGFNATDKKYRAIVLISDGEDHDEDAEKTARMLAGEGVLIHTVGIGSPEGAQIMDPATGAPKTDASGKPVITRLNEDLLRKIALTSGGAYTLFNGAEATAGLLHRQLQGMEKRTVTDSVFSQYSHYFQWFLAGALLLLLLESLIPEKKKRGRIQAATALLLLMLTASYPSQAQNAGEYLRKGNAAYEQQRFSEAASAYRKALGTGKQQPAALYNLGNALYKDQQTEEALRAYDDALSAGGSTPEQAETWYNKGVVLQQQKKLPDCIDAYKKALRLNPADADARLNLQQALKQQQQQQQQQPQQQPPKKQPQQPQPQQQQQPSPPRMSKREAEEKLRALMQHEKNLQEKLRKVPAGAPEKPEKDW